MRLKGNSKIWNNGNFNKKYCAGYVTTWEQPWWFVYAMWGEILFENGDFIGGTTDFEIGILSLT